MRRFPAIAVAALAAFGGIFAHAQNAQLVPLCTTVSTPADKQIDACNKILALKVLAGDKLAAIYY